MCVLCQTVFGNNTAARSKRLSGNSADKMKWTAAVMTTYITGTDGAGRPSRLKAPHILAAYGLVHEANRAGELTADPVGLALKLGWKGRERIVSETIEALLAAGHLADTSRRREGARVLSLSEVKGLGSSLAEALA